MQEGVPPKPENAERPGRWVAEESWPSPHIESRRLALNADGIATEPGTGRDLVHRSPQRVGLYAGEWCPYGYAAEMPLDQRLEDGQSLCFDSPGLSAPLEILGAPVAELELSVDRPNAIIAARLSDVAPGRSRHPGHLRAAEPHPPGEPRAPGGARARAPLPGAGADERHRASLRGGAAPARRDQHCLVAARLAPPRSR